VGVYLASDAASDITGQCIAVVGGRIDIISHLSSHADPHPFHDGGWTIETLPARVKTTLGEGYNLSRV
jgi:hypothetical protein